MRPFGETFATFAPASTTTAAAKERPNPSIIEGTQAKGGVLCGFAAATALAGLVATDPAFARCVNTTTGIEVTSITGQPGSNEAVICDATPPNPTPASTVISAAAGSTNVNVTIEPGAAMNSTVRAIGVVSHSSVLNQGQVTTDGINAFGISATGSGSTLTNAGSVVTTGSASWGMDARGSNTTMVNAGSIAVSGAGSAGVRTNAPGTSITNTGSIVVTSTGTAPNFPAGVLFQAGSTGTFVNQPGGSVSSVNGAGVRVVSDGLVTVRNAGTITSGLGFAVRFDANNNNLILDTGSVLNGDALSGGTGNTVRLQGTGSEDSNFIGSAPGNGFASLVMEGSAWTLSGNATITGTSTGAVSVLSGTLLLNGAVTNTGGTAVQAGTLAIGDGSHPAASLSGSGPVEVAAGAALGGFGGVTGPVNNSGAIAVANALPALSGEGNGTFSIHGDLANSGLLQVAGTGVGNRLVVAGNYAGAADANAVLNTFLGTDGAPSDRIVFDGGAASGATALAIANAGGPGGQTLADGILVVEALNGATTSGFGLNSFVSAGGFDYFLFKGGTTPGNEQSWFLRSTLIGPSEVAPGPSPLAPAGPGDIFPLPVPTPDRSNPPVQPAPPTPGATPFIGAVIPLYSIEVPIASSLPHAARQATLATLGTFHERRGGQRALTPAGDFSAAWTRAFGKSLEQDLAGTTNPVIDGSLWGFQAGLDVLRRESAGGHRDIAGLFFGYATLDADVRGLALGWNNLAVGDLDVHATSLGGYWTHIGPTGWYLDAVLMGSSYGGAGESRRGVDIGADGLGITVSLEGGYPFSLSAGWRIEPQAQLIWQHASLDTAESRFATVSFDVEDAVTGRIGARLEGEFETSAGLMQPYLKANLWHGFRGTDTIGFGINPFEAEFGATAVELGGGLVASVARNASLFATAGYTFDVDGEKYRAFEGNVGLNVKW